MARKPTWKPIEVAEAGYLRIISDSIQNLEKKVEDVFFPLVEGDLIVGSDYSGQHKGASHEAYSFIVTSDVFFVEWLGQLAEFRRQWLPDGRRLSFKKLNENVRWKSLPHFLTLSGELKGNLITILVSNEIKSFIAGGPDSIVEAFPDCFSAGINLGTAEKMFRLASFQAMILSCFRKEAQTSFWVSDHDETLDSHEKREDFGKMASLINFGISNWSKPAPHYFTTTELEDAPYWSEDLVAIADIAAGAYCKMSNVIPKYFGCRNWSVILASE
ncbi:hypothetical protein [Roseibium sp.]|uniref:hypothetical protein n=1 Tax=Roseibium sp. TaxID=1936156 RepID=UPI003BAEC4C5